MRAVRIGNVIFTSLGAVFVTWIFFGNTIYLYGKDLVEGFVQFVSPNPLPEFGVKAVLFSLLLMGMLVNRLHWAIRSAQRAEAKKLSNPLEKPKRDQRIRLTEDGELEEDDDFVYTRQSSRR